MNAARGRRIGGMKRSERLRGALAAARPGLLAFVAFLGCSGGGPSRRFDRETEEPAVFATVLRSVVAETGSTTVLVRETTREGLEVPAVKRAASWVGPNSLARLERGLAADWAKAVAERPHLHSAVRQVAAAAVLSDSVLDSLPGTHREYWDELHERYPGVPGYLVFSRVGFNRRGDRAIVFVGTVDGTEGRARWRYVLRRSDGGWTIADRTNE